MLLAHLLVSLSSSVRPPQEATRATLSVEAATYLAEALATMREESFHRDQLDWTAIRSAAFAAAAGAEVPADTYDAVRGALAALGDHHSFLQLPEDLARLESERRTLNKVPHVPVPAGAARAGPVSPFLTRRKAEAHAHDTGSGVIARIVVPQFSDADVHGFARELQGLVASLASKKPLGWIVDLRGNGGGNMWPMLAGLGPLLGEGRMGAFKELQGINGHWYYRGGKAGVEDDRGVSQWVGAWVDSPFVLATAPPVAVLLDNGTGSSGEAVAIAFRGRPRTRFVGTATYGLSSSNQGFSLGDGANLVITTGLDVDRTGKEYPGQVLPDEIVASPTGPDDDDPQLARALDWLLEQDD